MSDSEYIQQLEGALRNAVDALRGIEHSDYGGLDGPGYCGNCGWRAPNHANDCRIHVAIEDGARVLSLRRDNVGG